jgi:hypothetical protein
MDSFKKFLSIGNALDVHFYIRRDGVMVVDMVGGLFVCNRFFKLAVRGEEIDFIINKEAFLRALSVFPHMTVFDDGGAVKLVSKEYNVNLYKASYISTAGAEFLPVGEGRAVSKARARFIYDGFNLTKVPMAHMMQSMSLGGTSTYMGKTHCVEIDTPEFDFGDVDGSVLVDQGFIGFLKGYAGLADECVVSLCDGNGNERQLFV